MNGIVYSIGLTVVILFALFLTIMAICNAFILCTYIVAIWQWYAATKDDGWRIGRQPRFIVRVGYTLRSAVMAFGSDWLSSASQTTRSNRYGELISCVTGAKYRPFITPVATPDNQGCPTAETGETE